MLRQPDMAGVKTAGRLSMAAVRAKPGAIRNAGSGRLDSSAQVQLFQNGNSQRSRGLRENR